MVKISVFSLSDFPPIGLIEYWWILFGDGHNFSTIVVSISHSFC